MRRTRKIRRLAAWPVSKCHAPGWRSRGITASFAGAKRGPRATISRVQAPGSCPQVSTQVSWSCTRRRTARRPIVRVAWPYATAPGRAATQCPRLKLRAGSREPKVSRPETVQHRQQTHTHGQETHKRKRPKHNNRQPKRTRRGSTETTLKTGQTSEQASEQEREFHGHQAPANLAVHDSEHGQRVFACQLQHHARQKSARLHQRLANAPSLQLVGS